jgi:hypothetical protein
VSGNVLSPKFISSLRARPSHNESLLLFVISIFEPFNNKAYSPKACYSADKNEQAQ